MATDRAGLRTGAKRGKVTWASTETTSSVQGVAKAAHEEPDPERGVEARLARRKCNCELRRGEAMRPSDETHRRVPSLRPRAAVIRKVHSLRTEKGKIAAIEPRSGDFFLGDTLVAAVKQAREKYPARAFYFIRVGSPTAHVHHGGLRKRR